MEPRDTGPRFITALIASLLVLILIAFWFWYARNSEPKSGQPGENSIGRYLLPPLIISGIYTA